MQLLKFKENAHHFKDFFFTFVHVNVCCVYESSQGGIKAISNLPGTGDTGDCSIHMWGLEPERWFSGSSARLLTSEICVHTEYLFL